MSKDQDKKVEIPVEIVDNLIVTFEWIISSLNFWQLKDMFPCNLILKVSADYFYELRKIRNEAINKNILKKQVKKNCDKICKKNYTIKKNK